MHLIHRNTLDMKASLSAGEDRIRETHRGTILCLATEHEQDQK